jgi:replicative DNA helicase
MPTNAPSVSKLRTLTTQYRRNAMSLLLRDAVVFKTSMPHIPSDFFESNKELDTIFMALSWFWDKYKTKPKRHEVVQKLKEEFKKRNVDPTQQKETLTVLKDVWRDTNYTPEHVKAQLYDAIVVQQMTEVIGQAADLLDQGNYDELVSGMVQARSSIREGVKIYSYWDDVEDRLERREKKLEDVIPTGVPKLDEMIRGGLPRGKLGLVVAPSGRGKSAIMSAFCCHAIMHGNNGAFFSYELDADDVMARVDANIADVGVSDLHLHKKTVQTRLVKALQSASGDVGELHVRYAPTKSESLDDVINAVDSIRHEFGLTPDVFYLDYFDLLKSSFQVRGDQRYVALEEDMERLRGVAAQFDMACWTASQTNRGGLSKDLVDMDDVAAAYGKVFPLDLMITVSQSDLEAKHDVYKLYIAKNRLGPGGGCVWVKPNWPKMRLDPVSDVDIARWGLDGKAKKKKKPSPLGSMAGKRPSP